MHLYQCFSPSPENSKKYQCLKCDRCLRNAGIWNYRQIVSIEHSNDIVTSINIIDSTRQSEVRDIESMAASDTAENIPAENEEANEITSKQCSSLTQESAAESGVDVKEDSDNEKVVLSKRRAASEDDTQSNDNAKSRKVCFFSFPLNFS